MKKIGALLLSLGAIATTFVSQGCQTSSNGGRKMVSLPSDCARLNDTERTFASDLSNDNQMLFCRKFTRYQREEAIKLSNTHYVEKGTYKRKELLSPNEAVEAVYHGYGMKQMEQEKVRKMQSSSGDKVRWKEPGHQY